MKKQGDIKKFYQYAFPMQAAIVTCTDKKGITNPITVAWHTPISKNPPLYGVSIAPSRYSYGLIKNSKEFVINFADLSILEKVHFCGTKTGRNTDKIKDINLKLINSSKINTKSIKECFAHLECKLYKTIDLGDHTFFVGEVLNVIINKNAFEDDLIKNNEIKPCYYIGGNKYTTIDKIIKKF